MVKYIAKQPDAAGNIPFTAQENQTWSALIDRQLNTIRHRACDAFIDGLTALNLSHDSIPGLGAINVGLATTGWRVVPVTGTVMVGDFFAMLARREFPVATFIRVPEEFDYLQQPDIFHEIFGHCPLLMHPAYADFVQWYGEFAARLNPALQSILSRLFWFTIEFGLVKDQAGLRIYGGGILSSHQETLYALESDLPKRKPFNLHEILLTKYRYDAIQDRYFVLDSLESLYALMDEKVILEALSEVRVAQDNPFKTC